MASALSSLETPCFVVDLKKVVENASRMRETCKSLNLQLRPHTKTHKTLEVAEIQTNGSKRCIAVSTLAEAEYFADNGFDDILLAYPITENKIKRCLALMEKLQLFHVMVSNNAGLDTLEKEVMRLPSGKKWSIMLEIDAGYGRTGFNWDSKEIEDAAVRIKKSEKMHLESLYIHCGNSYSIFNNSEKHAAQKDVISRSRSAQSRLKALNIECQVGTGSTPTCSLPLAENAFFAEFHPGNYIFYDYEQYLLGSCKQSSIACRVMTRVIDHKPDLNMILVDCGFTALSHDGMRQRPEDFCLIEGDSNLRLVGMSQEIGKIAAKEGELDCRNYPIGTILFIIPFHGCATAALHPTFYVHSGTEVQTTWTPVKGW
ncbi:D-threo-3-hydroxyaspartate dehydratase [Aplysia californica]|uniref:D-threo-3-hydroxyaspartate dehydratase n=1 Tax=Aplysia californica TaxID=6500 RepID=A0ABM0JVD1_APLCA|nr:D-threo-3-hydroxyaspartate dehydratase [Aplysia californica]